MGLHPSIRSLLAANTGFTTGNVTSQPKQILSLSTSSLLLRVLNSSGTQFEPSKSLCLVEAFGLICFLFPVSFWNPAPPASPSAHPGHSRPGWLNRLQCDTCAVCWVAQHRGARAGALGLINIKSLMMVLSSP